LNLHGIAGPIVAAVNPQTPVGVLISTGPASTADDGSQVPGYATPGTITASIAGTVLTVSAVSLGVLMPGQALADITTSLAAGTRITAQLTGTTGGPGTYSVNKPQTVGSETMTTSLTVLGQVQPITWRDLQQLDGVNLGGVKWKIYLNGEVDAIVRPERKGGDLIVISSGRHQGTWLVAQVLEQFPDWCCAAIVQQNGG
jgi:hypothetical protein